jgi:hypothetical protein
MRASRPPVSGSQSGAALAPVVVGGRRRTGRGGRFFDSGRETSSKGKRAWRSC